MGEHSLVRSRSRAVPPVASRQARARVDAGAHESFSCLSGTGLARRLQAVWLVGRRYALGFGASLARP